MTSIIFKSASTGYARAGAEGELAFQADNENQVVDVLTEIDLDQVFLEGGQGFGPPGFEMEPPPVTRPLLGCHYEVRLPVSGGHRFRLDPEA